MDTDKAPTKRVYKLVLTGGKNKKPYICIHSIHSSLLRALTHFITRFSNAIAMWFLKIHTRANPPQPIHQQKQSAHSYKYTIYHAMSTHQHRILLVGSYIIFTLYMWFAFATHNATNINCVLIPSRSLTSHIYFNVSLHCALVQLKCVYIVFIYIQNQFYRWANEND